MEYTVYHPLTLSNQKTFMASIHRIDTAMADYHWKWVRDISDVGDADFKLWKYTPYLKKVREGLPIHRPEFFCAGSENVVDIMDGRHRIYALRKCGYDGVEVSCDPENFERLVDVIGK